jgi:hypothetical protein
MGRRRRGGGRRRGSGAAQSTNRREVTMAAAGSVLLRSFVALLGAWVLGCLVARQLASSLRLAGGSTEGVRAVPFRASAQGPRLSPPPAGVGLRRAVGVSANDFRRRRRQFQRGGCFVSRRPDADGGDRDGDGDGDCSLLASWGLHRGGRGGAAASAPKQPPAYPRHRIARYIRPHSSIHQRRQQAECANGSAHHLLPSAGELSSHGRDGFGRV